MNTLYPELARLAPQLPDAVTLPGVTLEWLYNGRIPCFTLMDTSRATVDDWMGLLVKVMTYWPSDQPYTVLLDASSPKTMLTPYVRAKVTELERINPALQGQAAVIMPKTFVTQMIRVFLRTVRRQKVATGIFFSRDDGLKWLVNFLARQKTLQ